MLKKESEVLLSDLLMKLIKGEQQVEFSRKALCNLLEFNPSQLFYSLCKTYQIELSPLDVKEFLKNCSVDPSDQEIYLMFRQYSSKSNGRLDFNDFSHLVLTSTDDTTSSLALNRLYFRENDPRVNPYFLSLLKTELELQKELEKAKVSLFNDPEFTL